MGGSGLSSSDAGDAAIDSSDGAPTGCPAICPGPTTGPATGSGACVNGECRISCDSTFPTLCAASGACVDLMSDGKNCGSCGHDCLGGPCNAGQCQPVMIAQYIGHPEIISVGTQSVYVTTDLRYVGRANKDGSDLKDPAMPGFASSAFDQTSLVESGDRVFFVRISASAIQLSYCLVSGCDSTATSIGGPYAQYFAVDRVDQKLVWIDYSPSQLWVAPTTATASAAAIPGATLPSGSSGSPLLFAQGGVYFADGGSVRRIALGGGSFSTIATGSAQLSVLGANSTSLFLFDGESIGYVVLPSGDGEAPNPLIATPLQPHIDGRFAADDASIYWVSGSSVDTCEIASCAASVKPLPNRLGDLVTDVGVDDRSIFWAADSPGTGNVSAISTVWKLAK
jgi:hypothetical protein